MKKISKIFLSLLLALLITVSFSGTKNYAADVKNSSQPTQTGIQIIA